MSHRFRSHPGNRQTPPSRCRTTRSNAPGTARPRRPIPRGRPRDSSTQSIRPSQASRRMLSEAIRCPPSVSASQGPIPGSSRTSTPASACTTTVAGWEPPTATSNQAVGQPGSGGIGRLWIAGDVCGPTRDGRLQSRSLFRREQALQPKHRAIGVPGQVQVPLRVQPLRFSNTEPLMAASLAPQPCRAELGSFPGPCLIGLRRGEPGQGPELVPGQLPSGVRGGDPWEPL
jgi:hypothetical protein